MSKQINWFSFGKSVRDGSDSDLKTMRECIETEIRRRKHQGHPITSYSQLETLRGIGGSVWWGSSGKSAAFVLNQNYEKVARALEGGKLFVYVKPAKP